MNNLEERGKEWNIDESLIKKLKQKGYNEFFLVQKEVIPLLVYQNSSYFIEPRDLCVSAPTGSGKTLAYALPIIDNLLKKQTITRLRALILLPSRELAVQVYQVFHELVENTRLKVVLSTSSTNIQDEKVKLVGYSDKIPSPFWGDDRYNEPIIPEYGLSCTDILISTPGRLLDHIQFTKGFTLEHLRFLILDEADRLLGNAYHGWVRSLISSTIGNEGKSLDGPDDLPVEQQHKSKRQRTSRDDGSVISSQTRQSSHKPNNTSQTTTTAQSSSLYHFHLPLQRLLFSATLTDNPAALALLGIRNPIYIHCKELYGKNKQSEQHQQQQQSNNVIQDIKSTREEEEFEEEIFELPDTLIERTLLVETRNRLLKLLGILLLSFHSFGSDLTSTWTIKEDHTIDYINVCNSSQSVVMIFVNSVDASHRLTVLLQILNNQITPPSISDLEYEQLQHLRENLLDQLNINDDGNSGFLFRGKVAEMTRLIKPKEREEILQEASRGEVSIIVSSDRMARGIDLPRLKLVINYDLPKQARTYIHRAGRTSRAGKEGMCLSLVKKGQVPLLTTIRESIGRSKQASLEDNKQLKPCYMTQNYLETITPIYQHSIQILPSLLLEQ
eukprot:gene3775-4033_t